MTGIYKRYIFELLLTIVRSFQQNKNGFDGRGAEGLIRFYLQENSKFIQETYDISLLRNDTRSFITGSNRDEADDQFTMCAHAFVDMTQVLNIHRPENDGLERLPELSR